MTTTSNIGILLLKDRRPDSCFLDMVYDPDVHGSYDNTNLAYVVPNVGALVIDRNNRNILYAVMDVDEITLKSTLKAISILIENEADDQVKIISYGNDKYMLYFDDRVKPTKLFIDSRLILAGASLYEFRLVQTLSDGTKEVISLYVNTDDSIKGNRIPLSTIGSTNKSIKQCTNCHTLHTVKDGDIIECQIFDTSGIIRTTVTLTTRRAILLNDLTSNTEIISYLDATSLQMQGSDFYIHQRQDISHLGIAPRLVYQDGTYQEISVDGIQCFMYGHENFIPAYPGQKQKILLKYFLGSRQVSNDSVSMDERRSISCEKWITVIGNESIDGIKISATPIYDRVNLKYGLRLVGYSDRRDRVYDMTGLPSMTVTGFNGVVFNKWQKVVIDANLQEIFRTDTVVPFQQYVWVYLQKYSDFQRYLISDVDDLSTVYGVESATIRRPIIHYDTTLKQYFIPSLRFMNKESFLDAFYCKSSPLYNTLSEINVPEPTHFTIRSLDTLGTVIPTPIEIEQYAQAWNITDILNPSSLVGNTVLVEFLIYSSGSYQIIYGAPVEVYNSTTGYNTPINPPIIP